MSSLVTNEPRIKERAFVQNHIHNFQKQVPHEFEDCKPYRGDLITQTNGGGVVRFNRR